MLLRRSRTSFLFIVGSVLVLLVAASATVSTADAESADSADVADAFDVDLAEAAAKSAKAENAGKYITCNAQGVCGYSNNADTKTVCGKGKCHSCTFHDCCNRIFTSPDAYCPIPGWRSSKYTGDFREVVSATTKRDISCAHDRDCPKNARCVMGVGDRITEGHCVEYTGKKKGNALASLWIGYFIAAGLGWLP